MKLVAKLVVGTTCVTILVGTAYVVSITLAPPPTYTVSNVDRIKSYEKLSVNNAYEKKTRSQEFYLGLSRWRRQMLKEEGLLQGRVLEVGAGCGGNVAYYPTSYFTDDAEFQKYAKHIFSTEGAADAEGGSRESYTSLVLSHIQKSNKCDEIILCDRSPGMIESCVAKVQSRLGYTPYRYPDYDLDGIRASLEKQGKSAARGASEPPAAAPVRKRKILHEDGTVKDVVSIPVVEDDDQEFLNTPCAHSGVGIAPILGEMMPGDKLPLLSKAGEAELSRREGEIIARQSLRRSVENALGKMHKTILERREARPAAGKYQMPAARPTDVEVGGQEKRAGGGTPSDGLVSMPELPKVLRNDAEESVKPQPLFSVANYAAEQLPFPDNSFDTVVDMFGLCSYDDPVRSLRELSRVCKPSGKILLIEHGKGTKTRVNDHLDKWAPRHAKTWGCWWNRDMRRVIRLSGLDVEKWDDKHFGTSHYIVAKPFKTMKEWDDFHRAQRAAQASA